MVNVEPVMMLVAVSFGFFMTSQPLFMYYARCVQIVNGTKGQTLENASSICAHRGGNETALQNLVEKDIATTRIYLQMANTIPTILMAPLVGTWADKRGRKNPLLFTMCGLLFYTLIQLLATVTYERINIYYWYFAGEFLIGVTGGVGTIFGTSFAIVTDDCRHKLKPGSSTVPMRIGVASFLMSMGGLIGTFGMSMLAVEAGKPAVAYKISYVSASLIQFSAATLAWIYAFFAVRETHFPHDDGYLYNRLHGNASTSSSGDSHVEQRKSFAKKLRENIYAFVEVLIQRRPGWTRCCLIMSLFFIMVEFLALDNQLLLLLVKRNPFSWSDKMFSNFNLLKGLLFSLGMILCPLMLTLVHWLGKDSLMILIGIAASTVAFFVISQANTTEEIFLSSVFSLLCGGIGPGYRSFLPRMVSKEQTARLLTITSVVMAFCPLLSTAVFNSIFNATIEWWPGFAFFVGGLVQVFVVIGQGSIHILMRPQWLIEKRLKTQMTSHMPTSGDDNIRNEGDPTAPSTIASDLHVVDVQNQRNISNSQ